MDRSGFLEAPRMLSLQPQSNSSEDNSRLFFHRFSSYSAGPGLTERRREHVLNQRITSHKPCEILDSAKRRLRGVLVWQRLKKDIRLYGTSSNLFDSGNAYKKHLFSIIASKQLNVKMPLREPRRPSHCQKPWRLCVFVFLLLYLLLVPLAVAFHDVHLYTEAALLVEVCCFVETAVALAAASRGEPALPCRAPGRAGPADARAALSAPAGSSSPRPQAAERCAARRCS